MNTSERLTAEQEQLIRQFQQEEPTWGRALLLNEIDALRQELAEAHASNDALNAKIKTLSVHETCACSYDRPDDVCMHHSPQLAASAERSRKLEEVLIRIADEWIGQPYERIMAEASEPAATWTAVEALAEAQKEPE